MANLHLFQGVEHAALYAKFRVRYPNSVYETIYKYIAEKVTGPYGIAVDVGCGSGQGTEIMATEFKNVIGTDNSEAQIQEAKKRVSNFKNIEYITSVAEKLPVPDKSADLIHAAMAVHWFDIPKFYEECDRILKPNGCVALVGYDLPQWMFEDKTEQLSEYISELRTFFKVNKYWDHRRDIIDTRLKCIDMAYPNHVRDDSIYFDQHVTLDESIGYISTWSPYQKLMIQKPGDDLLEKIKKRLLEIMGPEASGDTPITLRYNFFISMCRKPE